METNVRTFLREFPRFKARARRGETVKIKDRSGEFIFSASSAPRRQSLLGCLKGRIRIRGDLTRPTSSDSEWGF
jgi:hypothetical protein